MGTRFLSRITAALFALLLPAPAFADLQWTDIACETSSTIGTGTLTLDGALSGYLGFAAAGITSGNTVPYQIRSSGHIETGIGTFTDAVSDTLARTTVKYSTDGAGTALTLSADSVVCIGPIASLWAPDFIIPSFSAGATGPTLTLNHDSASPAINDVVGTITAQGEDSAGNDQTYSSVRTEIADPTSTSEDSRMEFDIYSAGSAVTALSLGTTDHNGIYAHVFDFGNPGAQADLTIKSTNPGGNGPYFYSFQDSASPAASDVNGGIEFDGRDSAANVQPYGYIESFVDDPTSTSEDAHLGFSVVSGGSFVSALTLGATPILNSEAAHIFNFGIQTDGFPGVWSKSTDNGIGSPTYGLFKETASPAAGDYLGFYSWYSRDSAANFQAYADIFAQISDATAASEDASMTLTVLSGGAGLSALTLGTTVDYYGTFGHKVDFGSNTIPVLELYSSSANASSGPNLQFIRDSASPAASDFLAGFQFVGRDSLAAYQEYGDIYSRIVDATSGSEDGSLEFYVTSAGSALTALTLGATSTFLSNNLGGGGLYVYYGQASFEFYEEDNYPFVQLSSYRSAPADGNIAGYIQFNGWNDAAPSGDWFNAGKIVVTNTDITDTTEDSKMEFSVQSAGADLLALTIAPTYPMTTNFGGDAGAPVKFNFGNDTGSNYPALQLDLTTADNSSTTGFTVHADSATPAASDFIGYLSFDGEDSGSTQTSYASIHGLISDPTNLSEDGFMRFNVISGGSDLVALTLGGTMVDGSYGHVFVVPATDYYGMQLQNSSAGAAGPQFNFYQNSASPAATDELGTIAFWGKDSAANAQFYGQLMMQVNDPTSTSEDSQLVFTTLVGGSIIDSLTLGTTYAGSDVHLFLLPATDAPELVVKSNNAATEGPGVTTYANSASPAASDIVGFFESDGNDSLGNPYSAGALIWTVLDPTTASVDTKATISVQVANAALTALTLGTTFNSLYAHVFDFGSASFPLLQAKTSDAAGGAPYFQAFVDSASPAANDYVGGVDASGRDSLANIQKYGSLDWLIVDATSASEDSKATITIQSAGASLTALTLGTTSPEAGAFAHIFDLGSVSFPNFVIQNSAADSGGPGLVLYQNSASPAAADFTGYINFDGKDSAANVTVYASIGPQIVDTTNTSEDSKLLFNVLSGGSTLAALTLGTTTNARASTPSAVMAGGNNDEGGSLELSNTFTGATGPFLTFYQNSASPAASDVPGSIDFWGKDSGAANQQYAAIQGIIDDTTAASEDGHVTLFWQRAGTLISTQLDRGIAKVWGNTTGGATPTLASLSLNMTSITDTAVGRLTVTIATDFDTATYTCAFGATTTNSTTASRILAINTKAVGSFEIDAYSAVTPTLADVVVGFDWACFGS